MIIRKNIDIFKDFTSDSELISKYTSNTWQKKRKVKEIKADTSIGKWAENIIQFYFTKIDGLVYLTYDDIRTNNFKKHAPFDAIVFSDQLDSDIVKKHIDQINYLVTNNEYGKLPDEFKLELETNRIYIVEIKSTRVGRRHKVGTNNEGDIARKIVELDDFLTYPKYLRVDNYDSIHSLPDYIEFCKKYRSFKCTDNCIEKIKQVEQNNMSFYYVRIYMDEAENIAYIIGFINKYLFIKNLALSKFKSRDDKSKYALYLSSPLRLATDIKDFRLKDIR